MRKRAVKDTEKDIDDEHDVNPWMGYLCFCPRCFYSEKDSYRCTKCGEITTEIRSLRVRLPRQKASKMRWKEFFEVWLPKVDFNNAWERRKMYLKNRG